jgi:23S rRNA (uracil1939-C5)-methyltransferase
VRDAPVFLDFPSKFRDTEFGLILMIEGSVRIEKIAAGGAGMGRVGGKVVFVPYTLPGEEVRFRVRREKKDYAEALPVEILEASAVRQVPRCPVFGECGGCDFQHMAYGEQRETKRGIFRETFRRLGGIEIGEVPFEEGPAWAWRNRVGLHAAESSTGVSSASGGPEPGVGPRLGPGPWGFKRAGDSGCVPLRSCPLAVREINDFLAGADGREAGGEARKLSLFGWGGRAFFRRREEIRLELCGCEIVFSPECFFQSNVVMLEKLVREAFLGLSGGYALDLYGGAGVFAVFLARRFGRVLSVEEDAVSSAFAARNLKGFGARAVRQSVEGWISSAPKGIPDLIVVDPPRTGLSPVARDFLRRSGAPRIFYVSCDAGTLARDSASLVRGGYEIAGVRIFDFYPQTAHVESLCCFVRAS